MNDNKIVITGIGMVSPYGIDYKTFWEGIKNGITCIKEITKFDTSKYKSKLAGEITNFDSFKIFANPTIKRLPLITQYALCATHLAIKDANLKITK